ncbi:MAG: hypothetical protein ACO3IL_05690 [Steroidobacteraceae bacterium]|jgi:hypothetical protein
MATSFGTAAPFGLTFETGIITDSLSYSYTQENKALRNGTGDITGKTYYNEQIEVSISGYIPTSTPYATTLAAAITLVTAPEDYLKGSIGTTTIVESVTRSHTIEDYQRIEVTAMNHPLIT